MRKALVLVVVALLFGGMAYAETVTWTNPTVYTDNQVIPPAKAAQLSTEIQYKTTGSYLTFGIATGGATTFSSSYVTQPGATSTWRARSISVLDNNATSVWSGEVSFTRPFQTPAPGVILDVR